MPKLNDLILTLLANPLFDTKDFLEVGLSANNTSLEDESAYLNSDKITKNPLFQDRSGEFDKNKFHSVYVGASKMLEELSIPTLNPQTVYSKYNIWAPISQRDMSPLFELVKSSNPDRITKSMIVLGLNGDREYTPLEIAQSQQIYNSDKNQWMDSPEDLFSIKKLFNDPIGFFSDNFGSNKVLAQYETDIDINGNKRGDLNFNESLIEHRKGEYMLNDNGTYYYRTLKDGENIHGKLLLHYSDILTREGSALNSIDFLDSDDIEKSTFGTFVKDAALIGAMFIPGGVGTAIAGATIFQQAAGLGATLGKIALLDSDNSTLNWIEGLSQSTNPLVTRSEYSSGDKMWTTENLLGMVADVVALLYQLRLLFKWAPMVTKGKWGMSEEAQTALKEKYMADIASKNKSSLDAIIAKYGLNSTQALKASQELAAKTQMDAAALVEDYMKGYYKSGELLSKAYMTMLTVNDIYSEAKEAGASDFDASLITAGYAAMEYALLSTDIGKWVLPELRGERLLNKAIVKALTKDTLETFKKLGAEATTSETAKRSYIQRLVDFGKNVAKGEFNAGLGKRAAFEADSGLLKAGVGSLFAGASAEALEETSEEVLADFSRVLFNGLQELKGNKDVRLKKPWEDEHLFDRYAMSFLGGFIGGGISSATFDFSLARKSLNMDYNKAVQELIWKARNNDLDGIYKILNNEEIGNKNLSASKFVEGENGEIIWKQGTSLDNQDLMIKNLAKRLIQMLLDTLEAHGGNMSDEHLIDEQILKDIRFRVLQNSTTSGKYIQKYNQTLGKLIEKTNELRNLNSPNEKVKTGETDKKERTEGESKEIELKRKKLEQEIKDLDELIDNFNTGKLAPLFMTSALLESTPFISEVFMRSSFKTYAENKAKTKYENIPEGELKTYWNEYLNYLRTTKKDDLDFATEGYLSLLKLIKLNFEEAVKVANDSVNNEIIKSLLRDHTLSTTTLNMLELDDDAWLEGFLKFVSDNPLTEKFITNILLIRNTVKEAKEQADVKYNEAKTKYDEQLANGEIEETVYQSLIKGLETERLETYSQSERGLDIALSEINTDILIEQANLLADNFINLGYINGAIKDTVVNRLLELYDQLNLQGKYFEQQLDKDEVLEDDERLNKIVEGLNKINRVLPELQNKIEQVKNLKYTPILQNLDQFALNLKSASVSQILEFLGNAILTNKTNIGAFTFGKDIHHAINEADRVIDLYIAALEGARTDTVDPFRINPTTGNTEENLWGINKVLNEVHAKAPKIEHDTWEDLPEIDGNTANMMLMDARSIKSLLQSYKKLFDINRGQKLEIQSRVGARTSYLLYDRVNRLLTNGDFPDKDYEGTDELKQTFNNLTFFNENVKNKKKEDWNINLSVDLQITLEKDKLALETAIFNFFNKNKDKDWEPLFSQLLFNLGDSRTTLLTEAADDIDESSFIGYLVSKIAINSTDFYSKYRDMLKNGDKKIAPLLGQEIGVLLHLGNILNGPIVTKVILAYRNSIYKHFKNLSFEDRVKFLTNNGVKEATAYLLSTQRGFEKIFGSYDLVPQYSNITFSDGIAGSGKTSAIMASVIKFLQTYYPDKFTKIWTIHGGDSDTETTSSEGLRKSIGLTEDGTMIFNKKTLMDKITPDRVLITDESGKSYLFKDDDYKLLNGKIVSNWKLISYSKEELPDIIVIDEAQQFTQLDLLTIDKFARENGISVIMSGDLLQSQMSGEFKLSPEDVTEINRELSEKNVIVNGNKLQFNKDNTPVTLKLSRNQVLHTPKIGTSMRTENNLKNMNAATILAVMKVGKGQIPLHYYIDDSNIAGDYWAGENEDISPMLDKMIANLKEGEKINFAYSSKDSEIYKKLKANSTYWNKINPIKGVALGLEGNYWILDIDTNLEVGDYLLDLYTGITRAKKASILVSKKVPVEGITLDNIQDSETHPEKYTEKAVEKSVDKRIKVLEGALPTTSNNIPYNLRNGTISTEPSISEPSTGLTSPVNPEPELNSDEEVETITKENPEVELPPVVEEVQPEDIEEESVSNELETQGKLSDANRDDNSITFDKVEISGFSKKDFNFYLFSNATFELGLDLNLINDDGTFNANSLLNNKRIDSLNGITKLFGINNFQEGIEFLAEARDRIMSIEDKNTLEKELNTLINDKLRQLGKPQLGNLYVRFAIKTTESNVLNNLYDKALKGVNETLPYARALIDPNSESNFANNRSLVAIIGENNDLLEIPLLMLNNPITIITLLLNGQYKYPLEASVYNNAYNQAFAYAQSQPIRDKRGYAQIEGLKAVLNAFPNNSHRGLTNLIRMYLDTNRKVSFIKNLNWTIGKNLHTFGPLLNLERGHKTQDYNLGYVQEDRWISLSELRNDPQLKITGIYHYTDKLGEIEDESGNIITIVSKAKHPFVLYTDSFYAHDGITLLNSDDTIIDEFLYLKTHPEIKQTIKLVYVLPPKFTIGEYIDSLIGFMVEGKKGVLGNQRTPFKILEGLIYDADGNVNTELIDVFKHSLGELTGQLVYDKVKGIVDSMKELSLQEQIKLLTNDTPQRWNINGFGLNTDVQLYQQLQNVIKQLVLPSSINILGNVNHKGSSDERIANTQKLSEIFAKSGLSLFYQTKGSKDLSQIKFGRFSPIQEVKDGVSIENDYIQNKDFMINGNLSTSTFMANEEFNNIIEDMLNEYHPQLFTTGTNDGYAYFRDNYSGFNSLTLIPSISLEILNKLNKFGLTTTITPTINNDNTIEIKLKIAEEINSKNSNIKALVLPNGELIVGKNDFFTRKQVEFRFDSNPFESQLNYQFDAIIDGEEYNVIYSETNSGKIMELIPKNNLQLQIDYSKYSINPNLNIEKVKELLNIIASTSNRMNQLVKRILLTEDDKLTETIINFLNQDMVKTLIKIKNLDLSLFTDILNFELNITQDSCNLSIKILFV